MACGKKDVGSMEDCCYADSKVSWWYGSQVKLGWQVGRYGVGG